MLGQMKSQDRQMIMGLMNSNDFKQNPQQAITNILQQKNPQMAKQFEEIAKQNPNNPQAILNNMMIKQNGMKSNNNENFTKF